MLPSAVVGRFPLGVHDGSFADFHNAVTSRETRFTGSMDEFNVRPLVTVMMNIVRDLAEQYSFRLQYPIGLSQERRECMAEGVVVLFRRPQHKAKSGIEILFVVPALVRDVGWVIDNDIERSVFNGHVCVVRDDVWFVPGVDVHASDWPLAVAPKPAAIHRRIEDFLRSPARVKIEHLFEQVFVVAVPDRG